MFVRVKEYDCIGWAGTTYRDKKTNKLVTPRLHNRGGKTAHYSVIESVRTDKGPRQRVVASWANHKSLKAAIADVRKQLAEREEALNDLHERHRGRPEARGRHFMATWAYRHNQAKAHLLRRQMERLEAAFAVLGDWTT